MQVIQKRVVENVWKGSTPFWSCSALFQLIAAKKLVSSKNPQDASVRGCSWGFRNCHCCWELLISWLKEQTTEPNSQTRCGLEFGSQMGSQGFFCFVFTRVLAFLMNYQIRIGARDRSRGCSVPPSIPQGAGLRQRALWCGALLKSGRKLVRGAFCQRTTTNKGTVSCGSREQVLLGTRWGGLLLGLLALLPALGIV